MVETWKWLLKDEEKEPGILLMETEVLESLHPRQLLNENFQSGLLN